MSIVTRTGDKGDTGLFGGKRVAKDDLRIESYGTVDELNAAIGMALALETASETLRTHLLRTQNVLFTLGADLATPRENNAATVPRIEERHVHELDDRVNDLESAMPALQHFILPGGSALAAHLHLARTICRRAERCVVALAKREAIGPEAVKYLNRLSDWLFLAAMKANEDAGIENVRVSYE